MLDEAVAMLRTAGVEATPVVTEAIFDGIARNAFEVIRRGEARMQLIALNRNDPAALDQRFSGMKEALAKAVRDHAAL